MIFKCLFALSSIPRARNNITSNQNQIGIELQLSSNYNKIIHNNFDSNNVQASVDASCQGNLWDDGLKGNYWSDYLTKCPTATEIDNTGVENTPYVIDASNIDHYPLTNPTAISEFQSPNPSPSNPPVSARASHHCIGNCDLLLFKSEEEIPNRN